MDFPTSVIVATMPKYMKELADETTRKYLRLALIRQHGNIQTGPGSGTRCIWPLLVRKPASRGLAKGVPIVYEDNQPLENLSLPWRGGYVPDSMSWIDWVVNQGPQQIINLWQTKLNNSSSALQEDFQAWSLAASDGILPHGLEEFLGYTPCASTDKIATPNDSYGDSEKSLSTVLGALSSGASWSDAGSGYQNATLANDFPNGTGPRDYNANSPLLVNFATTAWGTGDATWESNCWRVLTQALSWQNRLCGDGGKATNIALGETLWTGLKNHHETLRRKQMDGENKAALELGITDTLNFDGTAIHTEYLIPSGVGYIENMAQVEIQALTPELFWMFQGGAQTIGSPVSFDEGMDMHSLTKNLLQGFLGNFKYRPRHVTKIGDLTS
jgi:hypothetical protein